MELKTTDVRSLRPLRGRWQRRVLCAVSLAAAACYLPSNRGPAIVLPPVNGRAIAAALELSTKLDSPTLISFSWDMNEQGTHASGRGVARAEPPYYARLDLFMGNGETMAGASLVGDTLRVPSGFPDGIIPPSHLLWAALGVFRPGNGAAFLGALGDEAATVELRYGYPGGEEIRYRVANGRILAVDLLLGGSLAQRVTLAHGDGPYPREATYRNFPFRELKLTTQSIDHVESFPPDIWRLGP